MEGEMTLNQFVESKYFKLISRGCMVMLFPAVVSLASFILNLTTEVGAVREMQTDRAQASDANFERLGEGLEVVKGGVLTVQADVSGLKLEFAKVSGILQEMQRRDLAQAARPQYAPAVVPVR